MAMGQPRIYISLMIKETSIAETRVRPLNAAVTVSKLELAAATTKESEGRLRIHGVTFWTHSIIKF